MIYGSKTGSGVTLPPTLQPPTQPTLRRCVDTMVAPFMGTDRKLRFFHDNQLYLLHDENKKGVSAGPLPIRSYFEGVKRVDAVFQHHYYRSYTVFHGHTFSVFEENRVRYGGVRKIQDAFIVKGEQLSGVDAALMWPGTERLYIFRGEKYWRMRAQQHGSRDFVSDVGYPQRLSAKWRGLPKSIDSAFVWSNNKIYFTKGDLYYRWDERRQMVQSGYPIKLTRSFLECFL